MKTILIQTLQIRNFKGIQALTINFNPVGQTNISGDNGTGKTTVFDAFNWLLWGKNSQNESDFPIKTLDLNGQTSDIEHEVSGVLIVDGSPIELKRIYSEKWTKKRGSETRELTGHETQLFINDVPKSLAEYKAFIDGIINPAFARMITDPLYFNTQINWKERRKILTDIAGTVSDIDLFNQLLSQDPSVLEIQPLVNAGMSLVDQKTKIFSQKTKVREELNQIPSRLDEVNRNMPQPLNWDEINDKISTLNVDKSTKQAELNDLQKAQQADFEAIRNKQSEKFQLEQKLTALKNQIEIDLNKDRNAQLQNKRIQDNEVQAKKNELATLESKKAGNVARIEELRKNVETLRAQWTELNAKPIQSVEAIRENCPSCGNRLNESEIESQREQIAKRANEARANELNTITGRATQINGEIQSLQALNSNIETQINEINTWFATTKEITVLDYVSFVATPEYLNLQNQIENFVIPAPKEFDAVTLQNELHAINTQIGELQQQLSIKSQIEQIQKRETELRNQQQTLSQQIADFERTEMAIDAFNKFKIEQVELSVNKMFKHVKFKMFEKQLNGGEQPICEATIDGKPWQAMNTALQINAGLDIVNTLQSAYGTFAPVFIDNRESITEIQPMNCQIINLIKVTGLKQLEIL